MSAVLDVRKSTGEPTAAASLRSRADAPAVEAPKARPIIRTDNVSLYYSDFAAVRNVTMEIAPREVTAIIGPSGCGKSTLLRAMNRMNDFIPEYRAAGRMLFNGRDINGGEWDPVELRRRIGMVFQKPNPFPKSIFKNVRVGGPDQRVSRQPGGAGGGEPEARRTVGRGQGQAESRTPWRFPAGNSSVCALPARLPYSRKCC